MHQDEGGLSDALLLGAFHHYLDMIPDQAWYGIGLAVLVLVAGFILWKTALGSIDLHAIAETSTDRSLLD